jgi:hypothetical protein
MVYALMKLLLFRGYIGRPTKTNRVVRKNVKAVGVKRIISQSQENVRETVGYSQRKGKGRPTISPSLMVLK